MSADRIATTPRDVGEAERLATIARLGLTEPATVASFDALTALLRAVLDVTSAYIVIVAADTLQVWNGTGEGSVLNVPREGSFSDEVVRTGRTLVVPDARHDPRFGGQHYRERAREGMLFYVGIPLKASTGAVLGTLCGFHDHARPRPGAGMLRVLEELATTAVAELELATTNAELASQEAVLLNRTEVLEATFDNITEGVTIFDGDLRLVAVNRKGVEILGLNSSVHRDASAFDLDALARAGFYGRGEPTELLLRGREERLRRYLDMRPQPIPPDVEFCLEDGRTIRRRMRPLSDGMLTTYVDLSDLRRRQAELLAQARYFELQHKLAGLSNSAPDLASALRRIVVLNLREVNGALGAVWRRVGEGLVPQGILCLADRPDLGEAEEASLAASLVRPSALARRSVAEGRMTYTQDEGAASDRGDIGRLCAPEALRQGYAVPLRILDELYVMEFFGPAGIGPKSWHGHIIKDLECQLDLVAERDEARRRKTEMIATISHELRTPLTSMRGMLELLESGLFGVVPDEAAPLLQRASADSRVLGTLIEDVLAIHDIQHGEMATAPRASDLRPVLRDVARATGFVLAPDDGADLVAVFDEDLLSRALGKLAAAFGGADRPALVSVVRRGPGIRLVIEGRDGHGRSRGGGSVAVRLASCLAERAGGRVVDRSTFDRPALQIDLPREVAKPIRVAIGADLRLSPGTTMPAGPSPLASLGLDAGEPALRRAVGA